MRNNWRGAIELTPGLLFGRRWLSASLREKMARPRLSSGVPQSTRLSVLCGTLAVGSELLLNGTGRRANIRRQGLRSQHPDVKSPTGLSGE